MSLHEEHGPNAVPVLSGMIAVAAERNPLPERFFTLPAAGPAVYVHDKQTGRRAEVPLFAYGEVRRVLSELFG